MKIYHYILALLFFGNISAQNAKFTETEITIDKFTDGTLVQPDSTDHPNLVIFIQGSGPTDRNGNQTMLKNDGIKKIAQSLGENGIASFRFDKRIFKMNRLKIQEKDLRFEDFVTDVDSIISYFSKTNKYNKIILAGHSEGSTIGILAAPQGADALISLSGPGRSIDSIIVDQITRQSPLLGENAKVALHEISVNGSTTNYNPLLESVFRPSVQPYMKSWMKYNPSEEIAKLEMPILIINGSNDFQVDVSEAELLKKAQPNAKLEILEGMNHIFRKVDSTDTLSNSKTYNEPGLPLHPDLVPILIAFVNSI